MGLAVLAVALAWVGLAAFAPTRAAANVTTYVRSTADTSGEHHCPGPECTLREALEATEEGSGKYTIELDVEGTINLDGSELKIEDAPEVAIVGPGADKLTIDARRDSRVLLIEGTESVSISGVTMTGGEVENSFYGGGGIRSEESGMLVLEGVAVTGNVAREAGGGIEVLNGGFVADEAEIVDNRSAHGDGGGIFLGITETAEIKRSTIVRNRASDDMGGGIAVERGTLEVRGTTLAENYAEEAGGGIFSEAEYEEVKVEGSTLTDNSSELGGGMYIEPELTMIGTSVTGNEADRYGGGLWIAGPTTIETSTIGRNRLPDDEGEENEGGGGIYMNDGEPLTIRTSTIAANLGGGLSDEEGPATLRNSTVAANVGETFLGAGLEGEEFTLTSTIVAGNTSEGQEADCLGSVDSGGHNLLGEGPETEASAHAACVWSHIDADQFEADPLLAPLGDYGGPTETMPPASWLSPAINRGSAPTATDQRGEPRPVPEGEAFTDVGAVEVQEPRQLQAPSITPSSHLAGGQTITCDRGEWSVDTITDTSYTYDWIAEGLSIGSAETLTLDPADAGKSITCRLEVDNGVKTETVTTPAVEMLPATPRLEPSSLNFGPRRVGSGPTSPQSLTLVNEGGTALTVELVSDGDNAEFPLEAAACVGVTLGPGESCVVEAAFEPTVVGTHMTTVAVATSVGGVSATLGGTGTESSFVAIPSSLAFGPVPVGGTASLTVTVTDAGSASLAIGAAAIEGLDAGAFAIASDGCSRSSLEPGEECSLTVDYAPTVAGGSVASLAFGIDPTRAVPLSGTGIEPRFAIAPTFHEFGEVTVGTASAAEAFVVRDEGTGPMTIGTPRIEGEGASQFALAAGGGCEKITLQVGESCVVEVEFVPSAVGAAEATLTVPGSAPGSAALAGIGRPEPERHSEPERRAEPDGRGEAPPAGGAPAPGPAAALPTRVTLSAPKAGITVGHDGVTPIRLACPAGGGCAVAVEVLRGTGSGGGVPRHLGAWHGSIAAGAQGTFRLRLGRGARRALARHGKLPVILRTTVNGTVANRTIVLWARAS
ncbi:MAG TPA: choice-of-anchor D domain-containing protein [Solirubrobacterales bacterium]|nr:choice-of-anchor D domain-containing protein [Solirubrobacterales bacterium]